MCSLAACRTGVGYRSIEAFKCYYGSLLTPSFRRCTASSGRTIKYLGPVHTYPEICENANFFLRIRLACTRIQRIFQPYPEIFENALQSGIFFIRYEYAYVWTVVSANLRIRLRIFLDPVFTSSIISKHGLQQGCIFFVNCSDF